MSGGLFVTQSIALWAGQSCGHLGASDRWSESAIAEQLPQFAGWAVQVDAHSGQTVCLWKRYAFHNFEGVKLALHELLHLADDEDHHPEVQFAYAHLEVRWSTHSADGLTDNDWICAAKLEQALRHLG